MKASLRRLDRVGRLALLAALVGWPARSSSAEDSLVRPLGPAEVDWGQGMLRVRAGAAADWRLPGPDAVRADAERRARTRALALMRQALEDLPLGPGRRLARPAIDSALQRARVRSSEYQSNGGVMLDLELGFDDLPEPGEGAAPARSVPDGASPVPLALAVSSMPLEVRPTLLLRKEEWTGTARYRLGDPPPSVDAIRVRLDRAGRLLLSGAPSDASARAEAGLIIYVHTIAKK